MKMVVRFLSGPESHIMDSDDVRVGSDPPEG